MKLLLQNRFAPITSEIGFLDVNVDTACKAFMLWQQSIHSKRGVFLIKRFVCGVFEDVLSQLLPLTSVEDRRYVFIPTNGSWTAFISNGFRGTDVASPISYLAETIGCRGVRVVAVPHTLTRDEGSTSGNYGAVILEVYGPSKTEYLNYVRVVSSMNDGGQWVFDQFGTPFPFERLDSYKKKRPRDRFTFELLEIYLKELGLYAFDEQFYATECPSKVILVEKSGPLAAGLKEYSLSEAQSG